MKIRRWVNALGVLLLGASVSVASATQTNIADGVSLKPDVSITLKTGIGEEGMYFQGVGGKIDGRINPEIKVPEGAVVVADGKLKNAVVMLNGVKEGKKFTADNITVDNNGCVFVPRVSVGKKGGKLSAKNSDTVLHNTHLYLKKGNKNIFNIALPNKDQVIVKPLRKAGLVDVKCDAHEWMQAYIHVSTHPYLAVTDAAGAFSMGDVPAGQRRVR